MNVSPGEGLSKAIGRDEVDASMVEQVALLRQERTTYAPVRNQVIYSIHHGNVIAFIQRLYTLWSSGSGITPGLSEGVIFNMVCFSRIVLHQNLGIILNVEIKVEKADRFHLLC